MAVASPVPEPPNYSREFLAQVERLVRAIGTYACFKQVDLVRRAWYHDDLVRHRTSVPDLSGPWGWDVPCGIRPEMTYAPVEPRLTPEDVQTAVQTAPRGYFYHPAYQRLVRY